MGKILIVKGADFSENCINYSQSIEIENDNIRLIPGAYCGEYLSNQEGSENWYNRMRTVNTGLVYIEEGMTCIVSGLAGTENIPYLRLDAAIYSSPDNPSESTFLHSLNGDTTNYFPFNTEGNNTYTFTALYTGYYAFNFAGPNKTEYLYPSNYSITVKIL